MNVVFRLTQEKHAFTPFSVLKRGSFPKMLSFGQFKIISDFISLKNGISRSPAEVRLHFNFLRKRLSGSDKIPTASLAAYTLSTVSCPCKAYGPCACYNIPGYCNWTGYDFVCAT